MGRPAHPGRGRLVRRYLPIVVVIGLLGAAAAIWGGRDGGSSEGGSSGAAGDELIRSGPMTPQKAELVDETGVDFGPGCDTAAGRIKLPVVLAPPCVAPFSGDNGGATTPGVTGDEVKIIYYQSDPGLDPLGVAALLGQGIDVNARKARKAIQDYAALYNRLFETYGRRVVVEDFLGTGSSDDRAAARADAVAIAEKRPFAVVGGPARATPYLWEIGQTPDQGSVLAAEMVAKLAPPGKAAFAGDAATAARDRSYAVVHYDTDEGEQHEVFEKLRDGLGEQGIRLETDIEFRLDLNRTQEIARTVISKLNNEGVTTVIYTGDPLTPAALTHEATAQDYHPEWILGPNVAADSAVFARSYDQDQWAHGFGMALNGARGDLDLDDAWRVYRWAYGEDPPTTNAPVLEPPLRQMFIGIHLAGPNLTPATFRDGLFRFPVGGGSPTVPQFSPPG